MLKPLIKHIIKFLKNDFPTTKIGYKLINFYCFFRRHCKPQNFIIEEKDPNSSFYIAAVLIIKNEGPYLREWLEYHKFIGFEHFFIYDNESTDNTKEILHNYIKQGLVSYTFASGKSRQMQCYEDAIARYKHKVRWLAFIDADEYIYLKESSSIRSFLKQYEDYAGIAINWVMFDSNHHKAKPTSGYVISNYTQHLKNLDAIIENRHIKTIVNPQYIHHFSNPHLPFLNLSAFFASKKIVTSNQEKNAYPLTNKNFTTKIQINHYFSKSEEEYLIKINRGLADSTKKRKIRKIDYDFTNLETTTFVPRKEILDYLYKTIPETYHQ